MQDNLTLLFLVLGIAALFFVGSPSFKGRLGESRVHSHLRSKLDEDRYKVLRDLTLPTKGGTTQIDHVVVSPYGVFVIETKNMKGWVFGSASQSRWTVTLRRHKSQFQNPLRQNYKHIKAIQELLGLDLRQLHNVVAFVGSAEPKTEMPANVLWSANQIPDYIKSKRELLFTEYEIRYFSDRLSKNSIASNRQTRRDHIKHVKALASDRKNNTTPCPRCGAKMVERSNRNTDQNFLGCSRYPKCKGTRKFR